MSQESEASTTGTSYPHLDSQVRVVPFNDGNSMTYVFEGGSFDDIAKAISKGFFTTSNPSESDGKDGWDIEANDYARLKGVFDADGGDASGDYIVKSDDNGITTYLEKIEAIPPEANPEREG